MRSRSKSRLGHGLAAQWGKWHARPATTRVRRAWDGAVACSLVARRWQGVAGDLEGATGKVSGKEESSGMMAFTGEEGALMVMVKCDEVLQLGRGKGVGELQ
jgi:hypothetical protein